MSFNSAITVCLSNPEPFTSVYPWMEMLCREQTPGKGKMIFPEMAFNITGLESEKRYEVLFSLERLGNEKFSFDKKNKRVWEVKGKPKKSHEYKKLSKDTKTGAEWMKEPFSVPKARITNVPSNTKKDTFYLTPLHKYVPVIFIRDAETSEEMRFVVELAQFLPVTKYYSKEVSEPKAETNKFSTYKNDESGEPSRKRKAEGNGSEAPEAKRTPLQESKLSNWETVNYPAAQQPAPTFMPDYNYSNFNINYQPDPNFNQFYPAATTSHNPLGYSNQQYHGNGNYSNQFNNFNYQYPTVPMPNYQQGYVDYPNQYQMPIFPTPAGSPNTLFPQMQNENFPQLPVVPPQYNEFNF